MSQELSISIELEGKTYRHSKFMPVSTKKQHRGVIQYHLDDLLKLLSADIKKDYPE